MTTAASVALLALAMVGLCIVNWVGKYPPDSFSEIKRWTVALVAAGATMVAVGGIVLLEE